VSIFNLPLSFNLDTKGLGGAYWKDAEPFYPNDKIRQVERASIRAFMEKYRGLLRGRVLDFGAGTRPYQDLVDGEYVPLEQGDWFGPGPFDAVMCNQVAQYLGDPSAALDEIACRLRQGGRLVMTYPTNWPEVEETDLWRFTKAGMTHLLEGAGFTILAHDLRAELVSGANRFALGYGVVCTRS
jgi:SAM-dependent methyltransferase